MSNSNIDRNKEQIATHLPWLRLIHLAKEVNRLRAEQTHLEHELQYFEAAPEDCDVHRWNDTQAHLENDLEDVQADLKEAQHELMRHINQ